jgi:Tetrapyrrole (Corrin/Porphyrin) Methylases
VIERTGRLVVVGTGIRTVGQLTIEAIAWLKVADRVHHLLADPVAEELIVAWQGADARSLMPLYKDGRPRREAYDAMVARIAEDVRAGHVVCAAFYGHPGVFARPPHEVISLLRSEGYRAEMLPAVSAEDCLFADLGVDPGAGCLSYEATNFVQFDHVADPTAHLILWQIGMLGDWTHGMHRDVSENLAVLADKLGSTYPADHVVTVYQASLSIDVAHRADEVSLRDLPGVRLTSGCTLYVPPSETFRTDPVFAHRLARRR